MLLVIEDLHWSDEVHPTLGHFLSALNRERAALEFSFTILTLVEVHAMLRAIFQMKRPVRIDFLEALYRLTGGNPFFVEEVLKSLLAAGDIFFTGSIWDRKPLGELHIPRSIQDAVQQRTSLLNDAARDMLELAAVAGLHVESSLLQKSTGHSESELIQLMESLIAAQLIVDTSADKYAFRHALTQQWSILQTRSRQPATCPMSTRSRFIVPVVRSFNC